MGVSRVRLGHELRGDDLRRLRNAATVGTVKWDEASGLFFAAVSGERVPDAAEVVALRDGREIAFVPYAPMAGKAGAR